MLITEILSRNTRMYGNETALVERTPSLDLRREITWKQFDETASKVANALMGRGVKKGDKVVLLLMNCLEWLPIYFGILRTGALAVPLNFRFEATGIESCVRRSGARAMIFGEEFIGRIDTIVDRTDDFVETYVFLGPTEKMPHYAVHFSAFIGPAAATPPSVEIAVTDEAAIYFTSGTTGEPKAALLTHRNLEAACYVENNHHCQTHDDVFLLIPPLYHTGAKMHWFGHFLVGSKAVLLVGVRPEWIIEAVSGEKATVVWLLVPWALDILLAFDTGKIRPEKYALSQWRLMHIGAQPVPKSLIERWLAVFPGQKYDTNYGLTEATGPGCVHLGMENTHKVGYIGVPGFDWECRIVDERLNPVPDGDRGELIVRGPGVMKAYFGNPEATARTIRDGWLLTGDMAVRDADGFMKLVDRKKDLIITGGENIFPGEVEEFLQNHPDIQDVAVIGKADERLGEVVAAVVQAKPGRDLTPEDLAVFCEGLPRYKRPRAFFFGDIPRNPTGKIEKVRLRKEYGGR